MGLDIYHLCEFLITLLYESDILSIDGMTEIDQLGSDFRDYHIDKNCSRMRRSDPFFRTSIT